jgi:Glycosyltransferase family 28 C-terminal domain
MRTGPPTVVLATTNGTGMGHLSRQLALALASLGGMTPVLFSMSSAVPVTAAFDMRAEYCPGPTRGQVSRLSWDAYVADRITALLQETGASAFVFDGVFPYDGVLRALRRNPHVPFIWSRRGMWQQGGGRRALRFRRLFAAVLEPGDLASAGDAGRTATLDDARKVGPVTLVGTVPSLNREQARAELGLDPDKQTLLVTLGSTRRNDLYAAYDQSVQRFTAAGWQVVVTSSPLASNANGEGGGPRVISVFPLVKYLKAFDAAVSASGYNAVHELLYSHTPTLLVPNTDAALDDQRTRARVIAGTGLALSADPERPHEFGAALDRLLDVRVRDRLVAACQELPPTTGATQAARFVISLASSGPPAASERVDAAALHAQRFARRQVARALPGPVLNLIGKPRLADLRRPVLLHPRLAPVETPSDQGAAPALATPAGAHDLVVTDALVPGMFDGRYVEHLIAAASDDYITARAAIAQRHYRLGQAAPLPAGSSEQPRAAEWAKLGWAPQ